MSLVNMASLKLVELMRCRSLWRVGCEGKEHNVVGQRKEKEVSAALLSNLSLNRDLLIKDDTALLYFLSKMAAFVSASRPIFVNQFSWLKVLSC